jgi:hypothetical protein
MRPIQEDGNQLALADIQHKAYYTASRGKPKDVLQVTYQTLGLQHNGSPL